MFIKKASYLTLLLCTILTVNAMAESTNDLYKLYDVEYKSSLSANTSKVLSDYYNAQRTAFSYSNIVVLDDIDNQAIIDKLSQKLINLEYTLRSSYNRSLSEILSIEQEYISTKKRLEELQNTINNKVDIPTVSMNLPTKDEYSSALTDFKTYTKSKDIGKLKDMVFPVLDGTLVYHSDDYVEIATPIGSDVYGIYNSTVQDVDDNSVILTCPDFITIKYVNVKPLVRKHDVVLQDTIIGTSTDSVKLGMSLSSNHVDVSKIIGDNK